MGSFNATCMVTGMEINSRRGQVLYLPFKMNHNTFKEKRTLDYEGKAQSFWKGGETLFTPYLLPIKGDYDTYGRLEEIVKDENSKAIEKHFGVSIDSFMKIVSCSREFGSTLSSLTKAFLPANVFSIIDNNYSTFDQQLVSLGFEMVELEHQETGEIKKVYKHSETTFLVSEDDDSESNYVKYTVHHFDGRKQKFSSNFNHDLFKVAIKENKFFLGVPKEKQDIVFELYGLSGAFIHPDIYEFLSTFEADKCVIKNEKSDLTNGSHHVYGSDFPKELEGLNLFMKNLVRSNRMLTISKTSSEGYEKENTTFNLGLQELIHEESKKL